VYRYASGKADWLAAGLPSEGHNAGPLRAISAARPDIPTCRSDEQVKDAAQRALSAHSDTCIVTNNERVVLGRLLGAALDPASEQLAEDIMQEGPTTTRADEDLRQLVTRLHDHNVKSIVVTDPDGRLLGITYRDDADAALAR
jgi:Mg/Co/Ni transporter MgtE